MVSLDIAPITLLVTISLVLIIKNGIDRIGKKNIEDFLWLVYCKIAGKLGNSQLRLLELKNQEAIKVNKERKSISAQDNYAKWTKLNRQHDKLVNELNQLNQEFTKNKASVVKSLGWIITLLTTLPLGFSRLWYRKKTLFYLPVGVFPYLIERTFALPFGVTGGVGLSAWIFALNSVLSSIIFLFTFPFETPVEKPIREPKEEKLEEMKE